MAASRLGNLAGFASAAFKTATGKDDASVDDAISSSSSPGPEGDGAADKADTKTENATTAAPVKRGRGRPPKPGGPAPKKPVVLTASGEPRKRGRPRKEEGAEPKPKVAKTAKATSPGDKVERRGRPKKDAAAATKAPPAKKAVASKSRTRGKKEEEKEEELDEVDEDIDDDSA